MKAVGVMDHVIARKYSGFRFCCANTTSMAVPLQHPYRPLKFCCNVFSLNLNTPLQPHCAINKINIEVTSTPIYCPSLKMAYGGNIGIFMTSCWMWNLLQFEVEIEMI